MKYKKYSDLSSDIRSNVDKINYQDFDLIVGIPRSGMVPSYMVSLLLNVHCIGLPAFIRNEKLCKGITRDVSNRKLFYAQDAQNVLLVDDSVLSGKSMINALNQISEEFKGKITTMTVYCCSEKHDDVDIIITKVEPPRVFEWNIYHHPVVANSCFDIDGVLCYDPSEEQNDDGEKYIDFLKNAKPRFIPTVKIDVLITNRLEKYRNETESWLQKNKVKYNELVMLNLPNKKSRLEQTDYFSHKARYYTNSNASLFFESDINQAIEIANRSNKVVFCVDDNVIVYPGSLKRFKSKRYVLKKIRSKIGKVKFVKKMYLLFKESIFT